jgi:TolB protein
MSDDTPQEEASNHVPGGARTPHGRTNGFKLRAEQLASAWRWLQRPDEVGSPVTLGPRTARLALLLLAAGSMALVVLGSMLCQSSVSSSTTIPDLSLTSPRQTPLPVSALAPLRDEGAVGFTLRLDGNADIYAINQSDPALIRLTYHESEDRDPAWSPDGNYLAFASDRANNWDIYLLDLITGAIVRLTRNPGFDASPTWSPDGQQIAFESYRNSNLDIYVLNTSDLKDQRLTYDRGPDYAPAWSPDGGALAFTSLRDGGKDIYVAVLSDETQHVNITQSPGVDEDNPTWSPDSRQLAYVSGPRRSATIQVTTLDLSQPASVVETIQTFGTGTTVAWSPDGSSIMYAYETGGRSYLVASSLSGWALFHQVYSVDGTLADLQWRDSELSPRVVARARADEPTTKGQLYVELVQPTPSAGPPYRLDPLPSIGQDPRFMLSDRVNESFNALRERVLREAGWDYLGDLESSWQPITYTPPSGHSRMSWHLCGRAVALNQDPYESYPPRVQLVREDEGSVTYWRVYLRAASQDGSMGEPLRDYVWDLNARGDGGKALVEGGTTKASIPLGYYIDLTALASDYGWDRLPSMWRWRYFWPDIRWWELQKTVGLSWWDCMLEVYDTNEIERAFGPIPELDE